MNQIKMGKVVQCPTGKASNKGWLLNTPHLFQEHGTKQSLKPYFSTNKLGLWYLIFVKKHFLKIQPLQNNAFWDDFPGASLHHGSKKFC